MEDGTEVYNVFDRNLAVQSYRGKPLHSGQRVHWKVRIWDQAGAPSAWMAYVLVDDLKRTTDKARSLGATVMKEATEVPGMGSFTIITDPTGAMLGLWEPKKA